MDSHWYNVMVDVAPFAPRFDFLPSDFVDPYGFQGLPNPFPAQYGPKLPGPEATFLTPVAVYGLFQKDFCPSPSGNLESDTGTASGEGLGGESVVCRKQGFAFEWRL